MVSFKFAALAAIAFSSISVFAQDADAVQVEDALPNVEDVTLDDMQKYIELQQASDSKENIKLQQNLNVDVNVSFPDAEIFGVKMVNGRPTRCLMKITNNEDTEVNVLVAVGALLTPMGVAGFPDPPQTVRNLTGTKYGTIIPPKTKQEVTYSFATVMQPQDLTLEIKTMISRGPSLYTLTIFNEVVSIVEAPVSIFDPQIIFLYIFLAGAFGGTCYFIYNTWITTLFPQKKRGGLGGERAKRSSTGRKPVNPSEQIPVTGADGPAVTSSSQLYDESWIPAQHMKRPEAKRVGSGRPKSRAA